jgi:hypothetical protein
MSNGQRRPASIFSGLVMILFGTLFLLHTLRGDLGIGHLLRTWWPVLLIVWGLVKLVERMAAHRHGTTAPRTITGGEILLVLSLLTLVGLVVAREKMSEVFGREGELHDILGGNTYTFELSVPPKPVPANARIAVRTTRGDVTIRAEDTAELQVTATKRISAWSESEADRLAAPVTVVVEQTAEGFDVHPQGGESESGRVGVDIEVRVPKKAAVSVRNRRGDIQVSGVEGSVSINNQRGNIEIRDCADVNVDMNRGDAKVSDTKGNVKISGRGGEVEVLNASGTLTLNGEFFGSIRAERIAKGVRFVSQRTDLTVSQLSGRLETGAGNLELVDAPGNVTLRTHAKDISMENAGGKVEIENRGGNVELRFSQPPKDDISVSNASAGITLKLPSSAAFEIAADSRSGEIDSEFSGSGLKQTEDERGNAHLEGKVGVRGPKITLKTTYGQINIRKLS